jgi:hypothetical protein
MIILHTHKQDTKLHEFNVRYLLPYHTATGTNLMPLYNDITTQIYSKETKNLLARIVQITKTDVRKTMYYFIRKYASDFFATMNKFFY